MDNKKNFEEKRGREIISEIREGVKRRRGKGAFLLDGWMLLLGFLFARCHVAFGTYPLGLVLVASSPTRVIIIAIGAMLGSLTLGSVGYIGAVLVPLTVCLRVLFGGADRPTFSEPYVTRVGCLAISSALGGLYEILTRGFSLSSALFASASVLLSVGVSLSLYGVFSSKMKARDLFLKNRTHPASDGIFASDGVGWSFLVSLMIFVFLISFSLAEYSLFGVNLSLCFSTLALLIAGVRFGAVLASVTGFMSGLAMGANFAVTLAIAGGVSGFLYTVGVGYALVGGGIALSLWSAFSGGVSGLLSVLPEYGATALIIMPILKNLSPVSREISDEPIESEAREMVATATMEYRAPRGEVEESLINLATAMRSFSEGEGRLEFEEYRNIVLALTAGLSDTPCEENVDALASKLYKGGRPDRNYLVRLFGDGADEIYPELMRVLGEAERECYISADAEGFIGEYEHIGRMLMHHRYKRQRDFEEDKALSERLSDTLRSCGFREGVATALGKRRTCVIAAAEDTDEQNVASVSVKTALEGCVGRQLCDYEYYKKENTSLLKCYTAPKFEVEYAVACGASKRTGISGDTAEGFEVDGNFYSVISDGMGSGESAKRTSRFVTDYLKSTLIPDTPSIKEAVSTLSAILRRGREECAATVDIFSFDLYTGEGRFLKCGAATSYIKRLDSVFAVKCTSTPIGLLKGVDADEVMSEIRGGDIVVMMSDGVSEVPDEAAWLIEFLARPTKLPPNEYADIILALAKEHSGGVDDMTVAVLYVHEV